MFILDCNFPTPIINVLNTAYKVLLVAVPLGIVLFGVIDFIKVSVNQNNSQNNGIKTFVNRLITGVMVFFVFYVVKFVFTVLLPGSLGTSDAFSCAQQILR